MYLFLFLNSQSPNLKGKTVGGVVKVLDSQPRDREFESGHTISPWARFVPRMSSDSLSHKMKPGNTQRKLLYIDHP